MCGIAGIWGEVAPELIEKMNGRLRHRGPDATGIHSFGKSTLGHQRLSIMDPEGGDQPIFSEDGSAAIVANGEIYNFHRLRRQLEKAHQFKTTSDTETLLHLYEDRGRAMVRFIDGMFAFAIGGEDDLFLARDPIGIKPLYYSVSEDGEQNEKWLFASELKALADLDCEVREFPPATCYQQGKGFLPYYSIPERLPRKMPLDLRLKTLRETLEEAVVKRLMSDVPLGAFLSGGLDSSIIAAIAKQHMDELHTFSVGIEGSRDIEAARLVSRHIGSVHHEYIFTPEEVMEKLPEMIYHLESFDQDLVRSAIPCYFCSRLAAQHVKVILTGEGADELFAGYSYYKDIDDPTVLHDELRRSVESLHNVNLQRVDRLTMAHGLEGRVPFLDLDMIEMAQTIPPELKLQTDPKGKPVEKWILRKACEDLLPPEIVWRNKEQFDEGSGTVNILDDMLKEASEDFELEQYLETHSADRLRSPEEAFYHKMLIDTFGHSRVILDNVARWDQREMAKV